MLKEVMDKFIELVKAGKIEELVVSEHESRNVLLLLNGSPIANKCFDDWHLHTDGKPYVPDHLCAHIRRWLSGKGNVTWNLRQQDLEVIDWSQSAVPVQFNSGSELDWHLQAAIWVCEREG